MIIHQILNLKNNFLNKKVVDLFYLNWNIIICFWQVWWKWKYFLNKPIKVFCPKANQKQTYWANARNWSFSSRHLAKKRKCKNY